jgi:hypothetical protein
MQAADPLPGAMANALRRLLTCGKPVAAAPVSITAAANAAAVAPGVKDLQPGLAGRFRLKPRWRWRHLASGAGISDPSVRSPSSKVQVLQMM